eukprot:7046939-Ditylum_brightwellii.AAC.1
MVNSILGVRIKPDGNNANQVQFLREISSSWADQVQTDHIQKEDIWYYYQSTMKRSLEYPLLATTLTEDECRSIKHPALTATLNATGLASNFLWHVLSGTSEYMGLEAPRLYTTQGIKHVRALMGHGEDNSITGRQFRASIECHKMEKQMCNGGGDPKS